MHLQTTQNLLLLALLSLAGPELGATPQSIVTPDCAQATAQEDRKAEFEKRFEAAKGDREALWKVYDWADAFGLSSESRKVLRAILDIDDGDAKAHELLGHVNYDGKWFPNEKKKQEYQDKKEADEAKAKGYVRYKDQWVDPKDIPYLEKGWVKDEGGTWVDPEEYAKIQGGWVKQDLVWVSPEEKAQMDQGLWKCGDQWMAIEAANQYHSKFGNWWQIPGRQFVIWTTQDRELAEKALDEVDGNLSDLQTFFGMAPADPPHFLLLKSLDQYNQMAAGSEAVIYEALGLSAGYGGFFADLWVDPASARYLGCGIGYWDSSSDAGNKFGRHAVRFAAGLSFIEALDPSPKTLDKVLGGLTGKKNARFDPRKFPLDKFYGEKRLPFSLRYGAAAYFERYFVDRTAASGADVNWPRHWSVSNIERRGGLDSLQKILEFEPSPSVTGDPELSSKLISECGLVVSFVLQGNCRPVQEAHSKWKEAFTSGQDLGAANDAFFKVLLAHESEFRTYANS